MNRIKIICSVVIVAFLINLAILSHVPTYAKCMIIPTLKRLKQSRAVFIGQVLEIKSGEQVEEVRLRITRTWKGVSTGDVVISNIRHHEAPHYEVGKTYLVYAYGEIGKLGTGICSGTVDVQYAQREIKELERWRSGKKVRKM